MKQFEKIWNSFTEKLRGRLISQSKKQTLTYALAELFLKDAVSSWESSYEEQGRWLQSYMAVYREEGDQIRRILLEEMHFTEISPQKSADYLNYLIPAAGAAAGFGIASFTRAGTVLKVVSTVAPAAILYPAVKNAGEAAKEKNTGDIIDGYMGQLEVYRARIEKILG